MEVGLQIIENMEEKLQSLKSNGKLYSIDYIVDAIFCILKLSNLDNTEIFEISRLLQQIKDIAKDWESELAIAEYEGRTTIAHPEIMPNYHVLTTLKHIKSSIEDNSLTMEKFNEILNLYK